MIEDAPKASALVVVEQIATVQKRYEELAALIGADKVACWTSGFKTVERNMLRHYPVAVITHAAFMTSTRWPDVGCQPALTTAFLAR
jgi:hypothetical protein